MTKRAKSHFNSVGQELLRKMYKINSPQTKPQTAINSSGSVIVGVANLREPVNGLANRSSEDKTVDTNNHSQGGVAGNSPNKTHLFIHHPDNHSPESLLISGRVGVPDVQQSKYSSNPPVIFGERLNIPYDWVRQEVERDIDEAVKRMYNGLSEEEFDESK